MAPIKNKMCECFKWFGLWEKDQIDALVRSVDRVRYNRFTEDMVIDIDGWRPCNRSYLVWLRSGVFLLCICLLYLSLFCYSFHYFDLGETPIWTLCTAFYLILEFANILVDLLLFWKFLVLKKGGLELSHNVWDDILKQYW